ncbi:pyrimidine/purine-5'-nucleotide nucleosidase [Methylococcales bacterium]|mgnify:CR=1 FL=1|nr:pyrimidine/purine-5'-nucleotide nucleosidase [Methylococcales bacterium]
MQKLRKPDKAYNNENFLLSPDARTLRILSEYLEPAARFKKHRVLDTIVFFGSARIVSKKEATAEYNRIKNVDPKSDPDFAANLRKAQVAVEMSQYYEDAVKLSKMLTEWSMQLPGDENRFIVTTGGGPGIMEAANKGAKLAGGYTAGLGISLPKEEQLNKFVSPQLGFEFHYFFMRKFWFVYISKALLAFPGGFGTCDELFELLTLVQTKKIRKNLSIILYGEKFWKSIMNFDALVEYGMIHENDKKLFTFCNTPQEAFEVVTNHFNKLYLKSK